MNNAWWDFILMSNKKATPEKEFFPNAAEKNQ